MQTLGRYSNEEILPFIGHGCSPKTFLTPDGIFDVKMRGTRLECLRRSQKCVWCRRAGTVWLLQRHVHGTNVKLQTLCYIEECPWCEMHPKSQPRIEAPHLNLYHQDRRGNLIMMTQDHINPKSKGGSNKMENLQTMCRPCNQNKGSDLIHEFDSHGHRIIAAVDGGSSILPRLPQVHTSAA